MTKFCFRFQRLLPNSSSFQDDETEIKPEASFSTRNWLVSVERQGQDSVTADCKFFASVKSRRG